MAPQPPARLTVRTGFNHTTYDYFVFGGKPNRPLITITTTRVLIVHMPFWRRVIGCFSLILTGRVHLGDEEE